MSQIKTYEEADAEKKILRSADPIHFDENLSYRKAKYRHLSHQNGIIGTFSVRIVEAKNLKRHNWSLLGLGPVKHLGLSRAHGEVSSCATFCLSFRPSHFDSLFTENTNFLSTTKRDQDISVSDKSWLENDSIASKVSASMSSAPEKMSIPNFCDLKKYTRSTTYGKTFKTSTVQSNSNPIWPVVQSENNISEYQIHLTKGELYCDYMKVYLNIEMKEERTVADQIVPILKGGDDSLGLAEIDLTPLLHGTMTLPHGVLDEWLELVHHSELAPLKDEDSMKLRVIITYKPHGIKPRVGDIVAFESFARRPPDICNSRQILNPFYPMRVKDVRGQYVLVDYDMNLSINDCQESKIRIKRKTGSLRLHRNTIFVIERTNLVDSAIDIALKPADVVLSSNLGKSVSNAAHPYFEAVGGLVMPAVLSAKLMLEAAKIGGSAALVGIKSAGFALAQSQNPENKRRVRRPSIDH